ncbi:DNA polymerase alpha/epsilon subunit B-domain-containing protein [Chaetomidium leptoderma]|uniref:DNA-directed DNA polymerase n=1 Tax=Chaetomidium leptoderma TaxID=669021 RepID=A0AAN6ZZ21_9PEZI|nr:DNA polymerase alpha/epsilon subunit B-domain-containing protein [Chaetomidium leptoderma]
MVTLDEVVDTSLLQKPSGEALDLLERSESNYTPLHSFALPKDRQYQQQFADIYFLRLTKIKPAVEAVASAAWAETILAGETATKVDRVLDVRQGQLCWVVGTVYMDMPLKPSVLEDVVKDRWISAPTTSDHYYAESGSESCSLEDDSGRIRLVGNVLRDYFLVTGCIIGVMGTENASGDFEVIDLKFADLPPQPERWSLSKPAPKGSARKPKIKEEDVEMADVSSSSSQPSKKIAIVSGLEFSGTDTSYAMELNLLLEFLLGEALDPAAQSELSQISRLIIAGNSIARPSDHDPAAAADKPHNKKYGYDSSSYNPIPSQLLDTFLSSLLPSIPITLLPGALDPANTSYPQQPIHSAMFPQARTYTSTPGVPTAPSPSSSSSSETPGWLDPVTNPWEGEVEGWRVLGTGGQNLDDICKYVDSEDKLGMMEAMCRWRCSAPTAPDTLWSYPFQDDEPFVMKECPHLYFVGSQTEFGTKIIEGSQGQMVRLVLVPSFAATKEIVLIDTETLDVSKVKFTA